MDKLLPEGLSISIESVYGPCFVYLEAHIVWGLLYLSLLHKVLRYATVGIVLLLGWVSSACLFVFFLVITLLVVGPIILCLIPYVCLKLCA